LKIRTVCSDADRFNFRLDIHGIIRGKKSGKKADLRCHRAVHTGSFSHFHILAFPHLTNSAQANWLNVSFFGNLFYLSHSFPRTEDFLE
jgi:hypothetical protein